MKRVCIDFIEEVFLGVTILTDTIQMITAYHSRSVKLHYESSVEVDGIDVYRFILPKEALESGDTNNNNKGFCVTGPEKRCLQTGLLNIGVCLGQAGSLNNIFSTYFIMELNPFLTG